MHHLTILICTHNRADLLERVLVSLNDAKRPAIPVQILVAANACTDDTMARMQPEDIFLNIQCRISWIRV